MKVKVKGTRLVFRHNYTPRWVWIASLLIMWNALMFGFFITSPIAYALIVIGVIVPVIMSMYLSITYIITDKEIVVIKYRRIAQRIELERNIGFRARNVRAYIFSFGRPVGDIEVYNVNNGKVLLVIKGVRDPEEKIRFIKTKIRKVSRY